MSAQPGPVTPHPVVCNASPLIALRQIGQLDLIQKHFTAVFVPPAVVREVTPTLLPPPWIVERTLTQPVGPQILRASLGPGESEAICLAIELGAHWIVMDERPARRLAQALGIPVIGTVGLLVTSKRRGLISELRPHLDALIGHGFRLSGRLYERAISDAGEKNA
jgi:predicted nucleic acid-binding protein